MEKSCNDTAREEGLGTKTWKENMKKQKREESAAVEGHRQAVIKLCHCTNLRIFSL